MKRFLLVLCSFMFFVSASPVLAITIDVFNANTEESLISGWISNLGGQIQVLEDFEEFEIEGDETDWYQSLGTGVGTFTTNGSTPGSGATSYNEVNNSVSIDPLFSLQDSLDSWFGRKNTTEDGSQWLDSGDIDLLTLTGIDSTLTNLFFYIQDPSDVGAETAIGTNVSDLELLFNGKANGASYFVGITLGSGEELSQISWTTSKINDGFGLDDFSTVVPIPEPITMMLFGIGLLGLAGVSRRKK